MLYATDSQTHAKHHHWSLFLREFQSIQHVHGQQAKAVWGGFQHEVPSAGQRQRYLNDDHTIKMKKNSYWLERQRQDPLVRPLLSLKSKADLERHQRRCSSINHSNARIIFIQSMTNCHSCVHHRSWYSNCLTKQLQQVSAVRLKQTTPVFAKKLLCNNETFGTTKRNYAGLCKRGHF